MRIFLVRHGQTDWNRIGRFQGRSDVPLNEEGRRQAQALASALKDESFSAIYSSPLIRVVETACQIQAFHPNVSLSEEAGLIEMDLGDFEGMEAKIWAADYPDFLTKWRKFPSSLKMPGGESLKEVQARAIKTLERIMKRHPAESNLLICSHNFVIRSILCHALNMELDRFRELKQATAAISILFKQGNRLGVEKINECSHLQ
jgi:probable phosphoglycerate mutase